LHQAFHDWLEVLVSGDENGFRHVAAEGMIHHVNRQKNVHFLLAPFLPAALYGS
jgi:hypothetical protein